MGDIIRKCMYLHASTLSSNLKSLVNASCDQPNEQQRAEYCRISRKGKPLNHQLSSDVNSQGVSHFHFCLQWEYRPLVANSGHSLTFLAQRLETRPRTVVRVCNPCHGPDFFIQIALLLPILPPVYGISSIESLPRLQLDDDFGSILMRSCRE